MLPKEYPDLMFDLMAITEYYVPLPEGVCWQTKTSIADLSVILPKEYPELMV